MVFCVTLSVTSFWSYFGPVFFTMFLHFMCLCTALSTPHHSISVRLTLDFDFATVTPVADTLLSLGSLSSCITQRCQYIYSLIVAHSSHICTHLLLLSRRKKPLQYSPEQQESPLNIAPYALKQEEKSQNRKHGLMVDDCNVAKSRQIT